VHMLQILKKPSFVMFIIVLAGSIFLSMLVYSTVTLGKPVGPTPTAVVSEPTPTPAATPTLPPVESPSKILGVQADPGTSYTGISWVRLGYPTCGWGNLYGDVLRSTIQDYHSRGIRVLLTVCQGKNDSHLYDMLPLSDAAQGLADAVQCGNEEMKQDPSVAFLYIPPANFARFYDLCQYAVHSVRPEVPVLLGSLDPHVGGVDSQPLLDQVHYLDAMQQAMNTIVHPGSHWDWHTETLGLIDSWHNGYPDSSVNSLYGLFSFWAQQFRDDLNSGQLGKHLWVVEGTGCFKGCGIDPSNAAEVAISHTLTLITDVQTVMKYKVPFFYFSGKDFESVGYYWPIGILDMHGNPKPIRQDLALGARKLELSCSTGRVLVVDQLQLLARMYGGCALPANYAAIIAS
jgi:hypothetical protein